MSTLAVRIGAGCVAFGALAGCGGGDPADSGTTTTAVAASATTTSSVATTPTETATSSPDFELPAYGVEPTTTRVLAAGEETCAAPEGATTVDVRASALGSPTAVVAVPDGFTAAARADDGPMHLTGPNGLAAVVTVSPTSLDAAAAFAQYADQRTATAPINSVSVLPGDLCGYSGQELMGLLAENPGEGVDYADRIVHVWTNDGDFLIAVQLEAPTGTTGFDTARTAILGDFGIRMP